MKARNIMLRVFPVVAAVAAAFMSMTTPAAASSIAITEWMYSASSGGGPAEYFELTNVGTVPIDMIGWSQDDSNRTVGRHPLDAFGTVLPGESVIGCEGDSAVADAFRTYWDLPTSVKVIGYGTSDNLGRSDEINLYDNLGILVDRLTYNDQAGTGPRTSGVSANIPLAELFQNNAAASVTSVVGDTYLSYRGGGGSGDIGNPGIYTPFVEVPEPASIALLLVGTAGVVVSAWRRRS
jgi:predicted extracellular nuclease